MFNLKLFSYTVSNICICYQAVQSKQNHRHIVHVVLHLYVFENKRSLNDNSHTLTPINYKLHVNISTHLWTTIPGFTLLFVLSLVSDTPPRQKTTTTTTTTATTKTTTTTTTTTTTKTSSLTTTATTTTNQRAHVYRYIILCYELWCYIVHNQIQVH